MTRLALLLLVALSLTACAASDGVTPEKSPRLATVAPSPESRMALLCVIGLGPSNATCLPLFSAAASNVFLRGTIYQGGYIENITFTGTDRSGDYVWEVKSNSSELIYAIAPPDRDGKIRRLAILQSPANNLCLETAMSSFNLGHAYESCRVIARAQ
jgi:hypothetical protein